MEHPIEISINKWQAKQPDATGRYAHRTRRPWRMLFSQNVETVAFQFSMFKVPEIWDTLSVHHRNGATTYTKWSEPPPNAFAAALFTKITGSHTGAYLDFLWNSDASIHDEGYKIDRIRLDCVSGSYPANTTYVQRNYPHEVFLLGTNDVVFAWTHQPPGKELGVLVWPDSPTHDVDLAVSATYSLPNTVTAEWTSTLPAGNPDMVVVPAHNGTGDRVIYIAVGSYSGAGKARFYANVHDTTFPTQVSASTTWAPTDNQKQQIRTQLRKTAQALYFATDGRYFIKRFDIYWNQIVAGYPRILFPHNYTGQNECSTYGNAWCGTWEGYIRFNCCADVTSPSCATCPKQAEADYQDFAGRVGLHEMGHCYVQLPRDERPGEPNRVCGHSNMGNFWWTDNLVDFCDGRNGGYDYPTGETGHPVTENNWACITSIFAPYIPHSPDNTPDPFVAITTAAPYSDYPFQYLIQMVEH